MTENWLLNWAVMAVSLFNTILLIWLGLTVLLNAESRTWGLWLAGGANLLGGVFFLVHSIFLAHGLNTFSRSIDFWWRVGWVPVVTIPYIWYVVILWYSGFWDRFGTQLNRRHYPWFVSATVLAVGVVILLIFANPLPSFVQVAQLNLVATPSLGGVPLLILIYPLYILLCFVLSVDVMRHPAPSGRIMGDLARRRARPWLVRAALVQILVSLLVGWVIFWLIGQDHQLFNEPSMASTIAAYDLLIASLIAIAVIFLGQAVTSYEVFTGKVLPRQGLLRYWRRAVILACGYAAVISLSLSLNLQPIYSVLLSALLMTVFYALLSWRSFTERQFFIDQLRPFVTSQRVYEQLVAASPLDVEIDRSFTVLCQDILGTHQAYLAAQGPLAPLVGDPVIFPVGQVPQFPDLEGILGPWISPENICIPLPQARGEDWHWLVPLWSERGLIGILLLGPKQDGGLYTQEEIEIARTVGERLVDLRASTEIARRLMALQRQRLVESQIVDRRTRRVLHDEVLPHLHAALLLLNTSNEKPDETIEALSSAHRQIANLLSDLPVVTSPEVSQLGVIVALQKTIKNEFSDAFDQVIWEIPDQTTHHLEQLSSLVSEVVYFAAREAIRNAARHGRVEDQLPTLKIAANQRARELEILIEDDCPGNQDMQYGEPSSGQGLTLHGTLMAVIGGELSFEQVPGKVTRVVLRVPLEMKDFGQVDSRFSQGGKNDQAHPANINTG
jgi:signal transduction histidine kinase